MVKKIYMVILLISLLSFTVAVEKSSVGAAIIPEVSAQPEVEDIQLPEDVVGFLEKANKCSYWIEAWNPESDAEHRVMIEDNINKICLDVIKQRKDLLDKYQNDISIMGYLQ